MSHRQYVRYCQFEGYPESCYRDVVYPHQYLLIWIECKRQCNPLSGVCSYPDPTRGWLDQDADLMLAFEVLEEFQQSREEKKERMDKIRQTTQDLFRGQT